MIEVWLPVIGFEGRYEVSSLGRVAGLPTKNRPHLRILSQFIDACGYYRLGLYGDDGKRVNKRVHALVIEAFISPRPYPEAVTRHLDGNSLNSVPSNLTWGTQSENVADSIAHGTQRNIRKTCCPRGHVYDEINTQIEKKGNRKCRRCRRDAAREYRVRLKLEKMA